MAGRPPARKCLTDALRIAMNAPGEDGERKVKRIAEKLVTLALDGDREAIKLIFERMEGKAVQPIAGDDDSAPVKLVIEWAGQQES